MKRERGGVTVLPNIAVREYKYKQISTGTWDNPCCMESASSNERVYQNGHLTTVVLRYPLYWLWFRIYT